MPGGGTGIALDLLCLSAGAAMSATGGLATRLRAGADGRPLGRAGVLAAGMWIARIAARMVFYFSPNSSCTPVSRRRSCGGVACGAGGHDGSVDPAALARPVPLPWGGQMPLGEWLERYPVEFLVHTWDLAQATGQAAGLDRELVRDALEPAREFIPVFRMSGLVGPECVVAQDADDLTRLLAIFGRRNSED